MRKEPIIFDQSKPFAHYESARKLKKSADGAIAFGRILTFVILPAGLVCAVAHPLALAMFTLFGSFYTILAVMGCNIRRTGFCLGSIPFALGASITTALSGSPFGGGAAVLYFFAVIVQCRVISAINDISFLNKLPGFPFFEPGLEDVSFAALEIRDEEGLPGDIEEEPEQRERAKYVPIGPPSEEMPELFTDGEDGEMPEMPFPERDHAAEEKSAYEKMANALPTQNNDVSDFDILGF